MPLGGKAVAGIAGAAGLAAGGAGGAAVATGIERKKQRERMKGLLWFVNTMSQRHPGRVRYVYTKDDKVQAIGTPIKKSSFIEGFKSELEKSSTAQSWKRIFEAAKGRLKTSPATHPSWREGMASGKLDPSKDLLRMALHQTKKFKEKGFAALERRVKSPAKRRFVGGIRDWYPKP